jgi:hypothetical protein
MKGLFLLQNTQKMDTKKAFRKKGLLYIFLKNLSGFPVFFISVCSIDNCQYEQPHDFSIDWRCRRIVIFQTAVIIIITRLGEQHKIR